MLKNSHKKQARREALLPTPPCAFIRATLLLLGWSRLAFRPPEFFGGNATSSVQNPPCTFALATPLLFGWLRLAFRAPEFFWGNSTEARDGAARTPLPTSSPPKMVGVRVSVKGWCRVGSAPTRKIQIAQNVFYEFIYGLMLYTGIPRQGCPLVSRRPGVLGTGVLGSTSWAESKIRVPSRVAGRQSTA